MKGKDRRLINAVSGFLLFVACLIFGLINVSTVNAAQTNRKQLKVANTKVAPKTTTKMVEVISSDEVPSVKKVKPKTVSKRLKTKRAVSKTKKTKVIKKTRVRAINKRSSKVTRAKGQSRDARRVIRVSFKATETKQKPGATKVPVQKLDSITSNPGGMEVALMPRNR